MASNIALDSGALIALSRGSESVRAILERWTRAGFEAVVPCLVLAEALRGKPSDAAVDRIINTRSPAFTVLPVLEDAARDAGIRIGRTSRKNVTDDALIVAVCVASGVSDILTGDPRDIGDLAGSGLAILPICPDNRPTLLAESLAREKSKVRNIQKPTSVRVAEITENDPLRLD